MPSAAKCNVSLTRNSCASTAGLSQPSLSLPRTAAPPQVLASNSTSVALHMCQIRIGSACGGSRSLMGAHRVCSTSRGPRTFLEARNVSADIPNASILSPRVGRLEFRNTRDSRRDRAANRLDQPWHANARCSRLGRGHRYALGSLRAQSQPRATAPDGRPAQVVDVTLRPRFDPLAN
jgi:hypothetical protein